MPGLHLVLAVYCVAPLPTPGTAIVASELGLRVAVC